MADPRFAEPRGVDMVLGADIYQQIIRPGVFNKGSLLVQNTAFGWVFTGLLPGGGPAQGNSIASTTLQDAQTEELCFEALLQLVQRFWSTEEVPLRKRQSSSDIECEQLFRDKHGRTPAGRYIVPLPLKEGKLDKLGESLMQARTALAAMHQRMNRDPELAHEYREFMNSYINLGHMRALSAQELQDHGIQSNYIPHHGIWQKSDKGRKLRVVFNASRPTSSGYSFNDILHSGPKLQNDISKIITRWRQHRWAFCADIKMMFRQIQVHTDHIQLQRILWAPSEDEPIVHYVLLTVTYGEACAPYLSLRTLHQLCEDEGESFPKAVECIKEELYVDDFLCGADDIKEAKDRRDQLEALLQKGGFILKKWVSNDPEILDSIPKEDRLRPDWHQFSSDGPVSELGVMWDPVEDCFRFNPPRISTDGSLTKRIALSELARVFDPVGWLAPVVVAAKMIIQDFWRAKFKWDDPLPEPWSRNWQTFRTSLTCVDRVALPRWIGKITGTSTQLHVFSDASRRAMAAVIFSRVSDKDGNVQISLIGAKTKLSPMRSLLPPKRPGSRSTIPRLELRAALIAARLMRFHAESLNISLNNCHAWCDNTIVLCWLHTDGTTGNDLVDGYVSQIHEIAPGLQWHHVSTKDNPADVASRGTDADQLIQMDIWWRGPSWLTNPPANWPSTRFPSSIRADALDANQSSTYCAATQTGPVKPTFIEKFSDLDRLLRAVTRCQRMFRRRVDSKTSQPLDPLTADERSHAFLTCIKFSQQQYYEAEINRLSKQLPVHTTPGLRGLDPFVDGSGIMRARGRLNHAELPEEEKFPPILSGQSHLARLIISKAHEKSLHAGFRGTYGLTTQSAWIVNGPARVKSYIQKCVVCARAEGRPTTQLMGQLPSARVTPSRPFSKCGVDYAGPFSILKSRGRNVITTKGYIALFVCLSSKAIHLELVGDMTTASFLGALDRFSNRRGHPKEMWSDNGTNFRGANLELHRLLRQAEMDWGLVEGELAKDGTTWQFIPPGAPPFGGLWEAGVKSAKKHLKRLIAPRKLVYEEFNTLLTHVERILNSRPLGPLSGDLDDVEALTSAHLMIGTRLDAFPRPVSPEAPLDHVTHWKLIQRLQDHFWDRWSKEYLNTLRRRPKWTSPRSNIAVGDLVILLDPSLVRPDGRYPLGRVLAVHPGDDGFVRVVRIRTASGEYTRPISKISRLPVSFQELTEAQPGSTEIPSSPSSQ